MRQDLPNTSLVRSLSVRAGVAMLGSVLVACASFAPADVRPGQGIDAVLKSMGTPTGRYALAAGSQRLEYARGPYGLQTWMVDVDAAGRVVQVQQVLDETRFASVQPGATRDEVLLTLGRPGSVAGAWRDRKLWYWRYENHVCRWFVVTLTPDDRVQDAGFAPDPACDHDDDDDLLSRD